MRIILMGTPDFAVPSLQALLDAGHEIAGVFTQPDKPKGRGYQLTPPPVKVLAEASNIPVWQPATLKDGEVLELLRTLAPELIVVVAYGKILPKSILDLPAYGCVNVHASLLPRYRGAAPIQWSVLNGDAVTGVTTMHMAEGLDTGDMIFQRETPIGPDETADELHDRLAALGASLLCETVACLAAGTAPRTPQDDAFSVYAPMLHKGMSPIDFTRSAAEVHNQIRGLSGWPCATAIYDGKKLKVHRSALVPEMKGADGALLDQKRLIVGCGGGAVEFLEVQAEGARRMSGEEYLRGRHLSIGAQFE